MGRGWWRPREWQWGVQRVSSEVSRDQRCETRETRARWLGGRCLKIWRRSSGGRVGGSLGLVGEDCIIEV